MLIKIINNFTYCGLLGGNAVYEILKTSSGERRKAFY